MLSRIITPATRSLLFQQRNVLAPTMRFAAAYEGPKPPTMDDLPVPSGSWETQNKANQTRYNMHLAFGVIFFTVTLIIAKSSGILYFNYYPPSQPADPSDD